jgi:hypothetical protein
MQVTDQLYLFGIRHHGPGCAASLIQALHAVKPDVIALEAAQELEASWSLCGDDDMCPPVAQLIYDPNDPKVAFFYPWGEFSPEWQAMQYAVQAQIPVRMLDCPAGLLLNIPSAAPAADDSEAESDAMPSRDLANDEIMHYDASLLPLARLAGMDDVETWWDIMVEHHPGGLELFAAIAEAVLAVRPTPATTHPIEAIREAWMRQRLREISRQFKRVAVVCGAWHIPALIAKVKVSEDRAVLKGLKKSRLEVAWVPYTYQRFSQASGYRAGVQAPGWYAHLFRHHRDGSPVSILMIEWMARIAGTLRQEGFDCSSAETIAAVRLSQQLARLAGRNLPLLEETLAAAQAVMTQGQAPPLHIIHEQLVIGDRLGRLPDHIPKLPVEQDLDAQCRRLRLKRVQNQQTFVLDLRQPMALQRSILWHRLQVVSLPWGQCTDEPTGLGTFKETWHVQWQPEFAVQLIDISRYGNTIIEAATTCFLEQVQAMTRLSDLATALIRIQQADLSAVVPATLERLHTQAAITVDLLDLMHAVPPLIQMTCYGTVRALSATALRPMVDVALIRITHGLATACIGVDETGAYTLLEAIAATHTAIGLLDAADLRINWQRALQDSLTIHDLAPLLAGGVTRLLYDLQVFTVDDVDRALRVALSSGQQPEYAAAWLAGLLHRGALCLLHDQRLLTVLDDWLMQLSEPAFIRVLPALRRTFTAFSIEELKQFGDWVQGGGSSDASFKRTFDPELADQIIPMLQLLLTALPDQEQP